MCCSVINASEMQTAVQVVVFFHSYFCLLMFTLILKCCCILLSHNIETTDMPQRRLCHCCWETLNSTVRTELWSVPKHEEKQHGDDQTPPETGATSRAKKNTPGRNLIKLRVECALGKKKKNLKYKRVYFVWNSVWVGFQGRGPSSNHSHRLSVVSMLWLITVTFSVCSSLRVNVCQKKTF